MRKRNIRYSEAFKIDVVSALESGKVDGIPEAMRHFGITGATTVRSWLLKYGKNHLIPKVVRVEKPNEKKEIEKLRKDVSNLKRALAESHMESRMNNAWFRLVCDEGGIDKEAFKKKHENRL